MEEEKKRFSTWYEFIGGSFSPGFGARTVIPPNCYKMEFVEMENRFYIRPEPMGDAEIIELPCEKIQEVIDEMKKYMEGFDEYKKLGINFARGLIIVGSAGNSKSTTIRRLIDIVIKEYSGVVFNLRDTEDLCYYSKFLPQFRELQPSTRVLTVLEDIDKFYEDEHKTSLLLNLMDGIAGSTHFFVATTNREERVDMRLKRGGRFDKRCKLPLPNEKLREHFFSTMFKQASYSPQPDINEWISATEDFSYASMRELVVSVIVLKKNFSSSVETIRELGKHPTAENDRPRIGFGKDNNR